VQRTGPRKRVSLKPCHSGETSTHVNTRCAKSLVITQTILRVHLLSTSIITLAQHEPPNILMWRPLATCHCSQISATSRIPATFYFSASMSAS
jgi:hypothetical protein